MKGTSKATQWLKFGYVSWQTVHTGIYVDYMHDKQKIVRQWFIYIIYMDDHVYEYTKKSLYDVKK